ncbi:MAG: hypothetical protein ABII06_03685, partial [Pseudomonadota bacterium]
WFHWLILVTGYWIFMDPTPDGLQFIQHRATSRRSRHRGIQQHVSKGSDLKHTCNAGPVKFMQRWGLFIDFFKMGLISNRKN